VEVEVGKEGMVFESGPFNFFGVESLNCELELRIYIALFEYTMIPVNCNHGK
jgi:hypothetical protein